MLCFKTYFIDPKVTRSITDIFLEDQSWIKWQNEEKVFICTISKSRDRLPFSCEHSETFSDY